jgi:hypothetical protein
LTFLSRCSQQNVWGKNFRRYNHNVPLIYASYPVDGVLQAKQKLPPGIEIVQADDFREWLMDIRVLDDNPLYQGQIYRLSFLFGESYPIGMSLHHPSIVQDVGSELREEAG